MELNDLQVHWDNKTLDYDLERYNWPAWALSIIQEVAPQVTELETLHTELSAEEIVKVSKHVQNAVDNFCKRTYCSQSSRRY